MSDFVNDDPKYQASDPLTPGAVPEGVIISSDTYREQRIPAGQTRTRKWPVLHYGYVPTIDLDKWRFEVKGLVDNPLSFTWDEFQQLPRVKVFSDFHCVTRWSRLGNVWEGVSIRELMNRAGVQAEAKYVIAEGYDSGWTTNMPLADADAEDVLLADIHDGEPINADHGGPLRLVVPRLYAWKSAKWLRSLTLVAQDTPGYWEQAGYHMHGDPWVQNAANPDGERFRDDM
ncbi:MAG: sulfite oxidase-like oxidoreductase [Planctomycetaceae bacterium]|nr:sulfite oxidase-like oxidoreductase [Planctomycetaceae bacterium]MCB9950820.1 sulfite oxidase-like oxidoreductase [Planctomycetaceae bacterium]